MTGKKNWRSAARLERSPNIKISDKRVQVVTVAIPNRSHSPLVLKLLMSPPSSDWSVKSNCECTQRIMSTICKGNFIDFLQMIKPHFLYTVGKYVFWVWWPSTTRSFQNGNANWVKQESNSPFMFPSNSQFSFKFIYTQPYYDWLML